MPCEAGDHLVHAKWDGLGPIAPTTKRTWLTTPIVTAAPQQNSLP
jgi:hypothetical protein